MMRGDEPDPKQVEAIVRFARGLPMVVTSTVQLWVQYGVEDFQTVKPQVVADLVDRLLESVPQEMKPAMEVAAILPWFTKDMLRRMTNQADVNVAYYQLLKTPFIRPYAQGWALHDTVRHLILESLRTHDFQRYQQLTEQARALADTAFELGSSFTQEGRWYDALRLFEQSLAIRRQGDDLDARADAIYQIARTHHLMGNLEEARIRYRDALRLYERTANQRGIAACKTGLGRLTIQTGWLDDAVHELEEARQIYTALEDEQHVGEIEEVLHLANHIKQRQPV
jgi:tetratricopeptide (TPR) repeat protein